MGPKNSPLPPQYGPMLEQLQQQLAKQYAAQPVMQRGQQTRDQTIANMQAKWGGGQQNPLSMQQNVINRIGGQYGQAPVDLAARQAQLQQQAQMKADALRQQAAQQQALQDPNNPQNPNFQFAQAMTQGNSSKNQAPPPPADLGYGGN